MTRRFPTGLSLSALLHVALLFAAFWVIKPPPLPASDDSIISVSLVGDTASSIGPNQDRIQLPAAQPAPLQSAQPQTPKTAPAPAPKAEPAPPMPSKAAPVRAIPAPLPMPAPAARPTKNQAKAMPSPAPSRIPAAKPNNTPFGAQFDVAAATSAASGVNSPERKAPRLTSNAGRSTFAASGGGSKLQADLHSILLSQIEPCWMAPADLNNSKHVQIVVQMELAENGRIIGSPKILSPSRSGADATLLVEIDNARKAAIQCAPYNLPANRYDEWHYTTFRFDPQEMKAR